MKEMISSGKTVEEAVENGCLLLGVSRETITFEIVDLPKKKLFGMSEAKVKITVDESSPETIAQDFLEEVSRTMGLNLEITSRQDGKNLYLNFEGEDSGALIGRRGDTLNAMQYLISLVANRGEGEFVKICLDSGNFREKREKTLQELAKKVAEGVLKTGRSQTLEPMSPYERRIIHGAVSEMEGVSSRSIGDEPNRKVVVSSNNPSSTASFRDRGEQSGRPRGVNDRRNDRGGDRRNDRRFEGKDRKSENTVPQFKKDVPEKEAQGVSLYSKIEL